VIPTPHFLVYDDRSYRSCWKLINLDTGGYRTPYADKDTRYPEVWASAMIKDMYPNHVVAWTMLSETPLVYVTEYTHVGTLVPTA
jgi:hypothetical protein